MKNARFIAGVNQTGSSLTSQAVSSQVLSAYGRLTSVFGMGTGGPPSYRRRIQLAQISIGFATDAQRSITTTSRPKQSTGLFRLANENLFSAVM